TDLTAYGAQVPHKVIFAKVSACKKPAASRAVVRQSDVACRLIEDACCRAMMERSSTMPATAASGTQSSNRDSGPIGSQPSLAAPRTMGAQTEVPQYMAAAADSTRQARNSPCRSRSQPTSAKSRMPPKATAPG